MYYLSCCGLEINILSFFLSFFLSKHRNPFRSIPRPSPPLLPSARKTGSSSGEKGLSLSEGLGKEYMKWRKTSVGKTGAQAEGRHVVIRASQG
jgi:hypothetical protein